MTIAATQKAKQPCLQQKTPVPAREQFSPSCAQIGTCLWMDKVKARCYQQGHCMRDIANGVRKPTKGYEESATLPHGTNVIAL